MIDWGSFVRQLGKVPKPLRQVLEKRREYWAEGIDEQRRKSWDYIDWINSINMSMGPMQSGKDRREAVAEIAVKALIWLEIENEKYPE